MNSHKITAERLKLCREKTRLTQAQVAKKLSTQRQVISYHENGSRQPTISDIIFYSKLYGVSADYLLGLSSIPSTNLEIKSICEKTGLSENAAEFLCGVDNGIGHSMDNPKDTADFINAMFNENDYGINTASSLFELKNKVSQAFANISEDLYGTAHRTNNFLELSKKEQLEYLVYRLERDFGDFIRRYSGFSKYRDAYDAEQRQIDEQYFSELEGEDGGNGF